MVLLGAHQDLSAQYSDQGYDEFKNVLRQIEVKKYIAGDPGMYQKVASYSRKSCTQYLSQNAQYGTLVEWLSHKSLVSSSNNKLELLINGENKFPRLLEDLAQAQDHIHIQYYIVETEGIGQRIADILMEKARAGVKVRFIYDAFGSKFIKRSFLKNLRNAGVEVAAYLRVDPKQPWRTLNNRNHRKIVIIDGKVSYVGGLNIAERYVNVDSTRNHNPYYWRDTHLRIEGGASHSLQYIFLGDWNFAAQQDIHLSQRYFPKKSLEEHFGNTFVQTLSSGPDTDHSYFLASLLDVIDHSEEQLLLATPYYIPNKALQSALRNAARRGVDVQLMIPKLTDALLVNSVARSYYRSLIRSGVKLLQYKKGFLHSKTILSDRKLAIISSANLDRRSFFINFEVSAFVYDPAFAKQVTQAFLEDKKQCRQISLKEWDARPPKSIIYEYSTRVFAPLF